MGLIDDFVQNITKEVEKVQARSAEMLETYNLSTQIRDLDKKRNARFLEIGRLIYERQHNSKEVGDDLIDDKVKEIAAYEQEIATLETEVESRRAANDPDAPASKRADSKAGFKPTPGYECPACHAPASKDKAFCPICGTSLKKPGEPDVVDVEPNTNN
jgi:rubrerythrin